MFRKLIAVAAAALIAGSAFAQSSELMTQAQNAVTERGVQIEIPATATDSQLEQIIAIASTMDMDPAEVEAQVKQILGM